MKRIINMALIALTLSGGVALADRGRGRGRDTSQYQGGTVVTPTRGHDRGRYDDRRNDNRRYDNRRWDNRRDDRVVRVQRARPTFRNNRFYFAGGNYQTYNRPVIQYRYRNYYQRPALVVENIQPVSGYVWIQGDWQWDGYEWQWMAGHYEVDQSYQDNTYYDDGYYEAPSSGISVQGSWNF
jgi:hypothetical protein